MTAAWEASTIGEACQIVNGGTPKTDVASYWGGEHVWITPAEMGDPPSPYVSETRRTLTDAGLANSSARLLPTNSVILSSRAPIGHLVINTIPMATNQGCKGLVPESNLNTKFLYYYLRSIVGLLNDLGTGATFKELSGGKLAQVPIRIPPLAEQKRIVAILDQAFEAADAALVNATKNESNSGDCYTAYLREMFSAANKRWACHPLRDVCSFENGDRGVNYPSKRHRTQTGIPFINAGHLTDDGLAFEAMDYISEERFDLLGAGKIHANDILFCLRGSLGKVASVGALDKGAIASSLVIVRASERVMPEFLLAYFHSDICKQMIEKYAGGAAQPNLSAKSLGEFTIPLPPLSEQKKGCANVERIRVASKRLVDVYERKSNAIGSLKQSLLASAFEGRL
jgi:type I restriction enzyme S subunit